MNRFIKIGSAAKILGITVQTLRRWEKRGDLLPAKIFPGGTRYYDLGLLLGIKQVESNLTIGYARVSNHDQKKDLKTQSELLSFRIRNHS